MRFQILRNQRDRLPTRLWNSRLAQKRTLATPDANKAARSERSPVRWELNQRKRRKWESKWSLGWTEVDWGMGDIMRHCSRMFSAIKASKLHPWRPHAEHLDVFIELHGFLQIVCCSPWALDSWAFWGLAKAVHSTATKRNPNKNHATTALKTFEETAHYI